MTSTELNPAERVVDEIDRLVDEQLAAGELALRSGRAVLTGDAGTGKTHVLRNALSHLATEYSPDQVQFFFGAAKNSALAEELAALPQTAAAYGHLKTDPEPFVKHFRRERARRRRLCRDGRSLELPHLLVVIDDFKSTREMRADLQRLLKKIDRIGMWRDGRVSLLLVLRTIEPHSHEACHLTPHRIHLGGNDRIGEFSDAEQEWAQKTVGDRPALWCVRGWSWTTFRVPSTVFADDNREVTAAAICGAAGLPVTTRTAQPHPSRRPDTPLPLASLPHGADVRDANIGGVAIRGVSATSPDPVSALSQTQVPALANAPVTVEAVWIVGRHSTSSGGHLAGTRNEELAVRVTAHGADLNIERVEAAIRAVDPNTRNVDSARYAALWQNVTDQLREQG
ncbi:AAA family ATPase [Mycobacterium sp. DBP42]|uniref:AAA family ATPase n=1 Tax=Mycobacteriaceae TaxID=1762 RepID=UPI00110CAC9E|nr:AAA family ATPase [Mycobacterium sp. DBP42]TMS50708.1 hypothetical protein E0T84_22755 [Mycobacterium sp. DBP42]